MPEQFTPQSLMERLKALPAHVVYGQMFSEGWAEGMQRLVPGHMQEGFIHYIAFGHNMAGGFMSSLLSNDLMGAVRQADDMNRRCIVDWCMFLHNYAPSDCFGSEDRFRSWRGILNEQADEDA